MFRRFWRRHKDPRPTRAQPFADPATRPVTMAADDAMTRPVPNPDTVQAARPSPDAVMRGEAGDTGAEGAPAGSARDSAASAAQPLPPLRLDDSAAWKQRFRASRVYWTQIARRSPSRGLAASNRSGIVQLYTWDVPGGGLTQLTDRRTGKAVGLLSPDGRHVYYLDDRDGNEIGHFVRVPFEGGTPEDITPDLPPYAAGGMAISETMNLLACLIAGAEGFQLYCLDLGPAGTLGGPRRVWQSDRIAGGPVLSSGGEIAVVGSTERTGKLAFSLIALDPASGDRIAELWDEPDCSVAPVAFSPAPDDLRLLATTDRSGVKRPLIWDPRTEERTDLDLGGLEGEVGALGWSDDGRSILLAHFSQAVQQLYVYDLGGGALRRLQHPGGTISAAYFAPSGEILAHWQDAAHPPELIALDAQTGARTRTMLAAEEVPPGHPWRSVTFASSDGQTIQGWLGVPDGAGPFPTILETHGGPTAVQTEVFSPLVQAWLDHGFAVLSINYRGSTTFGKAFEEQIWGDLGHWEIEDMAAACDWLVREGISRPDQIFLTGWSYGGYLTLLGLGKRPELWAGGMAGIAIADWAVQYEDSAETLRGYQRALFGGTPDEKPDLYASASPITYAGRVAAPALVIQGRNDTRCPARPMELYEARMRTLGKPIEVEWFEAGHGSLDVEQTIHHQALMLRFAYQVLQRP
jgi:dipeptidyl aminopeptidase/acylaminoacyl peptidase